MELKNQFENESLQDFKNLKGIMEQKKKLEEQEKTIRSNIEKAMESYSIRSIDNEYVHITRVEGTTSTTIDVKKLQEKELELYEELLTDYPKVTVKKAYLMFKVK